MSETLDAAQRINDDGDLKELLISPDDALVIDACLKNDNFSFLHELLVTLAGIIVSREPAIIKLSEEELWYLRSRITPNTKVGSVTGLDLIIRIYECLNAINVERHLKELGLDSTANAIPDLYVSKKTLTEATHNGERNDKDTGQNNARS